MINKARSEVELGQLSAAKQDLIAAKATLESASAPYLEVEGMIAWKEKKRDVAITSFSDAIKLAPSSDLYSNRGHVYYELHNSEVTSLINKNKSGQDKWNLILTGNGGIAFVDLCTEPYAAEFEAIGQSFIDQANNFDQLKVKGDPTAVIPNYKLYVEHFNTYRQIGEKLQAFSAAIRSGDYEQALTLLDQLEVLNNQLPVIE